MEYFTHKWYEYIAYKWSFYVNCSAFFSFRNSKMVTCYDGTYNDKLMEEFERYYNAKKKYVDMYSYFKEEFGNYQVIEIKSYEDELSDYQKRVDVYSKELFNVIRDLTDKDIFDKIKDIDFKLLLFGYVNSEYYEEILKACSRVFNKANVFLAGKVEYDKYLEKYVDKDLLNVSFHDSEIVEVIRDGNNITLKIEDGDYPYDMYYLTFVNLEVSDIDKIELPLFIMSNSIYYNNNKYYYYLEGDYYVFYEFVCNNVLFEVKSK